MLSVVVVNYNSGYRLRQCVESLLASPPPGGLEVVVVENRSTDGSADFLAQGDWPGVKLLRPAVNLGYTHGNNLGFGASRGDLVLLLTPDMKAHPGALAAMEKHLRDDPGLGGLGGWCTWPDGSFHRYHNRLPTVRTAYLTTFGDKARNERDAEYRRYHMMDEDFAKPVEVPQPAGGCFLVRREIFPNGLMSPLFGTYWSDVEVARRVRDAGRKVMVFPDCRFTHDHDFSPKSGPDLRPFLALDYYVGAWNYFRLYEGRGAAARLKLRFGLAIAGRFARDLAAWALRRKPWREARRNGFLLRHFLASRNVHLERSLADLPMETF